MGLIKAGNEQVRRPVARMGPKVQYDYRFFGNLELDLEETNSRVYVSVIMRNAWLRAASMEYLRPA